MNLVAWTNDHLYGRDWYRYLKGLLTARTTAKAKVIQCRTEVKLQQMLCKINVEHKST